LRHIRDSIPDFFALNLLLLKPVIILSMATKKVTGKKTIKGLFGFRFPLGFQYRVTTEGERREVRWLIKQGAFKSIKEYEEATTKRMLLQS
jgi:hypothetical protein